VCCALHVAFVVRVAQKKKKFRLPYGVVQIRIIGAQVGALSACMRSETLSRALGGAAMHAAHTPAADVRSPTHRPVRCGLVVRWEVSSPIHLVGRASLLHQDFLHLHRG
jgi:hypothetical protein